MGDPQTPTPNQEQVEVKPPKKTSLEVPKSDERITAISTEAPPSSRHAIGD
jgi:hypothetical protein